MSRRAYPKYKLSGCKWFKSIPEHWTVRKLKHISSAQFSNVDKNTIEGEEPVRLCNYVDVYYRDYITGDLELMEATATLAEIRKFMLCDDDVLITKDSESWADIANSACVVGNHEQILCGYHLAQIRPNPNYINGRYLFRSFSARGVNDQFRVAATGITRYGLGKYWIDNGIFPVPPIGEQRAIASFLDRETEHIKTLISKKERQIALLQEKRTTLISHAVTKGLDPKVKMKNSGIDWLGEIPVHWELFRLKHLAKIQTGNTPSKNAPENYAEDGIPWVKPEDLGTFIPITKTREYLSLQGAMIAREIPSKAILICCIASVGKMGFAGCTITTNQQINSLIFNKKIDSEFSKYMVFASEEEHRRLANGNVVPILNAGTEGNISFAVPPIQEQHAIASFLENNTKKIDLMIEKINNSIDLLREYRTALISATVTGKIDVRDAV